MFITSLENEKIKKLLKLQKKKYRDLENKYYVEGYHLVQEAFKAGVLLEVLQIDEAPYFEVDTYVVSEEIMKKLSTTDTPTNIIGVCRKIDYDEIKGNHLLLLDEIQDPGNLGTIIRSAVAFGVDMILLSRNTVDLYNSKVLRSTQGLYCHIPIASVDSVSTINFLKKNGYKICGTDVTGGIDIRNINKSELTKYCLIMGNEGNGVSREIKELCDCNFYIPMSNDVESLNVGVACSIILYELER